MGPTAGHEGPYEFLVGEFASDHVANFVWAERHVGLAELFELTKVRDD
jgi:hypothetical protein